jgi:drug/metabolite transporter (DMT)-like permease
LVLLVASIWGSSFLWIAIGLDALEPGLVAFARVALGAAALFLLPGSRRSIDRADWSAVVVVGVAGNAGPALVLAIAQQWVESSVAGMMNAMAPLAILLVGLMITRRSPGPRQVVGLLVGFGGVLVMAWPSLVGVEAEPLGIALLVLMTIGYGISNNAIPPLAQRYGAVAVIGRAQLVGAVLLLPFGVAGLPGSEFEAPSVVAVLILGVIGTGGGRALNARLIGRTGSSRSSIVTYLIPVVAITLGLLVRDENIATLELVGTAIVLAGAWLTTRAQRRTVGHTR